MMSSKSAICGNRLCNQARSMASWIWRCSANQRAVSGSWGGTKFVDLRAPRLEASKKQAPTAEWQMVDAALVEVAVAEGADECVQTWRRNAGGAFSIESELGQGTAVLACVPLLSDGRLEAVSIVPAKSSAVGPGPESPLFAASIRRSV